MFFSVYRWPTRGDGLNTLCSCFFPNGRLKFLRRPHSTIYCSIHSERTGHTAPGHTSHQGRCPCVFVNFSLGSVLRLAYWFRVLLDCFSMQIRQIHRLGGVAYFTAQYRSASLSHHPYYLSFYISDCSLYPFVVAAQQPFTYSP